MRNKTLWVTLSGLMSASVLASAAPHQVIDKNEIDSLSTTGGVKFNVNMIDASHRNLKLKTDALHFQMNDLTVDASPVTLLAKQARGSYGLWFGRLSLANQLIAFKKGKSAVKFNGVHLSEYRVDHGQTLDAKLKVSLNSTVKAGDFYKVKSSLGFTGIKTADAMKLNELFGEVRDNNFQTLETTFMFKALPLVLAAYDGTAIDFTLNAQHNKSEKFEAKLHLLAPKNPDQLLGPSEVFSKSDGHLDIVSDKKLLVELCEFLVKDQPNSKGLAQKQLKQYLAQGYLKPQGSDYVAHMTLHSGKLMINNKLILDVRAKHKQIPRQAVSGNNS